MARRKIVLGAAALAARPAAPAAAQEVGRPMTGPKVFLDYSQEDLDRAYDQRAWAPNVGEVRRRYAEASAATRARFAHQAGVAYGPSADEALDVFPAAGPGAPVHVFVHGGAWRARIRDEYHCLADGIVPAGATFVALGFSAIPDVRLPEMAEQVRRGLAWIYRNARSFGGDPERLYVSGHSSGAHLAAVALTTDWTRLGLPPDVLKGGLLVSGMYDLRPVLLSARSAYVEVSPDEVDRLSPRRHLDRLRCPLLLACGGRESPEFQRHARDMAAALRETPYPTEPIVAEGENHFEAIGSLGRPDGLLARAARRQMGVG
jgi:arylformamidase